MSVVQIQKPFNLCRQLSTVLNVRSSHLHSSATSKEYTARKLVGFSDVQMYTVVSDVKNYERFVPFCTRSTVMQASAEEMRARLDIGFPPIIESYTSHVRLVRPRFVSARCSDGMLFNYLETTWNFSPGLPSNARTCIVDFYIRFEFKSMLYSQVANLFFEKLVAQMEWAFISEAQRRYGKESVPSHRLTTPPRTRR